MKINNRKKYKRGNTISDFHCFNYYDKKYYDGEMYESAVIDNRGETCAVRFCISIKQKNNVIAFMNGFCSAWEFYFNSVSRKKMADVVSHHPMLSKQINVLEEYISIEGFDYPMYNDILREDKWFGRDNGFVVFDDIYVAKEHRGKKLMSLMLRVLEEQYSGDIVYCFSDKPFLINDFDEINNKKKVKHCSFKENIWYSPALEGAHKKNKRIINKKFGRNIVYSKEIPFECSSETYMCYVVASKRFLRTIYDYGLPF